MWLLATCQDVRLELGEACLPGQNRAPDRSVPAGVALGHEARQGALLDQVRGAQQRARNGVHAAEVSVEQIVGLDTLPAKLGVEVESAGDETAALQDRVESERHLLCTVGELVGVPTVLRI